MSWRIDLTGRKFGKLIVIEGAGSNKHKKALWKCLCECGNFLVAIGSNLQNDRTTSCGCEHKRMLKERRLTHGMSTAKEYHSWHGIKSRCYNPKDPVYKHYGARGIIMCDEWKNSFEAFYRDMGACPPDKYSVGRKDNNGNYCLDNCRWEDHEEQSNNTRRSVWLEHENERLTQIQWTRRLSVYPGFIADRLAKNIPFSEIVRQAKEYRLVQHWHEDLMESAA